MDPKKVRTVTDWPSPTSCKEVQRFFGFANFYHKFIRNFSTVAAPLHALPSPEIFFAWSPQAAAAFCKLKNAFSSAPVLVMPDASLQFIVEVDASDLGVGTVLSQRSEKDDEIHPCGLSSKKLSSTEQNYDIGDRELLAIKIALEEWRHWLEGAAKPFIVWTSLLDLTSLCPTVQVLKTPSLTPSQDYSVKMMIHYLVLLCYHVLVLWVLQPGKLRPRLNKPFVMWFFQRGFPQLAFCSTSALFPGHPLGPLMSRVLSSGCSQNGVCHLAALLVA